MRVSRNPVDQIVTVILSDEEHSGLVDLLRRDRLHHGRRVEIEERFQDLIPSARESAVARRGKEQRARKLLDAIQFPRLEPRQCPAAPGELCTCGRQAVVVFLGGKHGLAGYCGRLDGGAQDGPCPFCGDPRHEGRCPQYTLRLDRQNAD